VHVIASFEYSTYLEIALIELEQSGVPRTRMIAAPLEVVPVRRNMIDSIHRSDGSSMLDVGMALGTAVSVVTASLGMTLRWGPVFWGLIGAASGFVVGLLIDVLLGKRRRRTRKKRISEVIVIVDCESLNPDHVADTMWKHQALGVAVIQERSYQS
jgi:hypothetical protein